MKTKIIGLFTAIILFLNVSFANGVEPSEELQREFNRAFAQSTDVEWNKVGDYYKASFLQEGKYFTVYFDAFNNVESISRNISTDMLPMILHTSLKENLSDKVWITDCFELFGQDGTEYFVVVENADEKIFYQANQTQWEVFKKAEK